MSRSLHIPFITSIRSAFVSTSNKSLSSAIWNTRFAFETDPLFSPPDTAFNTVAFITFTLSETPVDSATLPILSAMRNNNAEFPLSFNRSTESFTKGCYSLLFLSSTHIHQLTHRASIRGILHQTLAHKVHKLCRPLRGGQSGRLFVHHSVHHHR